MITRPEPPLSELALIERCKGIAGLTFSQLAGRCGWMLPKSTTNGKGWAGQLLEFALGANAGSQAEPDFLHLMVELKTLPLNHNAVPAESTYVTNIPLMTIQNQCWDTSTCWQKLKRVLWLPIEGDKAISIEDRRIGMGFLWTPSSEQVAILRQDWQELVDKIVCGKLEEIDASQGRYLQIRPKAANAKALTDAFDSEGNRIKTLPRGFYLRPSFTSMVLCP